VIAPPPASDWPASDWDDIAGLAPAGVGFLEPAARQPSVKALGAVDGLIGAAPNTDAAGSGSR
jgi:hypothetical protein